jgi:O-antigen/teichoic acid export membrane protein
METIAVKSTDSQVRLLTNGKLIFMNTIWNILGNVLPLIIAFISIPLLIKSLGIDRFGILSLAWVVIGYFGLFDLGLGRALTKMVSAELGSGTTERIPSLVWTTLLIMLFLGIVGAVILASISSLLTYDILRIPPALRVETFQSLILLAVSVPIVIITSGFKGVLEAKQCFGIANAIRVPLSILMYAGPLFVIPFSQQLQPVIAVLLAVRIIGLLAHLKLCLYVLPELRKNIFVKLDIIKPLFKLGGWMTVSNIVGPLMVYGDRLLISGIISVSLIAYYTTPCEVVSKVLIIPSALVGVLFPAFCASYKSDRCHAVMLWDRSIKYIFIILFPITLLIIAFSYEGLTLWLGQEFSFNAFHILRWLAFGVYVNSFSQLPFTLIQGAGRPDITAKFHLIQVPIYLTLVWFLTKWYGLEGAAMAWTLRVLVDAGLLFYMARRFLFEIDMQFRLHFYVFIGSVCFFILICLIDNAILKTILTASLLTLFALITWTVFLSQGEKDTFRTWFKIKSHVS